MKMEVAEKEQPKASEAASGKPMSDLLLGWFKGNESAHDFVLCLWNAAQEWDDVEDEGNLKNINALLSWLMVGKEYHPYFQRHGQLLRPTLLTMYLQWRAANVLDHGSQSDVVKAYMLRAGIYSVFHVIAWIEGGDDWAAECGPEIYRSYGESPEELWKEFNACPIQ